MATDNGGASSTVAERLAAIRRRVADACARAGRNADAVTLVGAAKRQPIERLRAAAAAGLRVFGENQVQEAEATIPELPVDLDWHFIGTLQSNKAKAAARLFSTFHSIDRVKIARALDREAAKLGRRLAGFLQVHLGEEPTKHGFPEDEARFVEAVRPLAGLGHVRVVGLMAIPPWEDDPDRQRAWFRRLVRLRDALAARPEWADFPGLLSMGMSEDYEVAVEEGATHVRVGTLLFGPRPD